MTQQILSKAISGLTLHEIAKGTHMSTARKLQGKQLKESNK